MADDRGNLALQFLALAGRLRPKWVVWENVPGVLSSAGGRDFGSFLGGLGEFGYGWAYRVLDAQYAGVPQRRRRVFVVGYLGDWRRAAAVLFERHSLSGHPAPRREAGKGTSHDVAHSLRAGGFDASEDGTGRGTPLIAHSLRAQPGASHRADSESYIPITHTIGTQSGKATEDGTGRGALVTCLFTGQGPRCRCRERPGPASARWWPHRKPREKKKKKKKKPPDRVQRQYRHSSCRQCEKLQGFEPGYTAVTYRGKPAADGPRYKALGNSMAIPVVAWIGERIAALAATPAPQRMEPAQRSGGEDKGLTPKRAVLL